MPTEPTNCDTHKSQDKPSQAKPRAKLADIENYIVGEQKEIERKRERKEALMGS